MAKLLTILFTFAICLVTFNAKTQVITASPALPSQDQAVTITFNANEGAGGLKDYSGDIYAHTGVITNKSTGDSDWKYVKAEWTENLEECKLNYISENKYEFKISPSILEFYNIPSEEYILKIAIVFRNEDGSLEGKDEGGKDIFLDVYSNNLGVAITNPNKRWVITEKDSSINFSVSSNKISTLSLKVGDTTVVKPNATELNYLHKFSSTSALYAVATASTESDTTYDSCYVLVRQEITEQQMPDNLLRGVTEVGDGKVGIVLEAPHKEHVFLLGDFNNWLPSNDFQLKKDGSFWWMILEDIAPNTEYGYQYFIDGELLIADPYSLKILDPWNDQHISNDVYPNLKSYPANKTDGIVSVFETNKTPYKWQANEVPVPNSEELIIYELLIRDFVESSAIKDVTAKLDYLQELGINAIELMPFNEFEGNSSWGYNPSFYFATDKYYGTETDYKTFIDECHKRGIIVLMDIVFNHAFGQCPLVQLYFDSENNRPSNRNPWFNAFSPNNVYSWGYDFNHEAQLTKDFIDKSIEFWMTEYKIDGFRFDFTKGFTNTSGDGQAYDASRINILKRFKDVISKINENGILICEHLADNSEETELANYGILLWGNMNHSFNEASMGYYSKSDLSWTSYEERGWNDPNLIAYMESHDEERLMFKNKEYGAVEGAYNTKEESTALDRMELNTVIYFSIPGPKMIWQFGELGYDYSINYNGRVGEKPVKWDYFEDDNRKDLYNTYSLMANLKKELPVFNTEDFSLNIGNTAIKTILLQSTEQDIITLGNFGTTGNSTLVEFSRKGYWYELFSGDSIYIENTVREFILEPGEYRLFSTEKLSNPYKKNPLISGKHSDVKIYPNPGSSDIKLTNYHMVDHYIIYNTNGQKLVEFEGNMQDSQIDVSNLPTGLYFFKFSVSGEYEVQKFIRT